MITEFKLYGTEIKSAEEFETQHGHYDVNKGAIGGHISYIFTPTGIGTAIKLKCSVCNEEKDITDYNTW